MTSRPRVLRSSVLLASAALVLSACGGDGDDTETETGETPSAEPTPSTTVEVPEDVEVTEPGTTLSFGDTATVPHEAGQEGGVLELTVESAEQAPKKDFAGFNLDDPYKKRGNYYYVRVAVTNAGEERFGDIPVPLWGVSGDNTLLQAVEFTSSFKKCPTEPLPQRFQPGDEFKTCLVYLSPNRGSLEGVSYRPTEEFDPIEWTGNVKTLPEPKNQKNNQQQGNNG